MENGGGRASCILWRCWRWKPKRSPGSIWRRARPRCTPKKKRLVDLVEGFRQVRRALREVPNTRGGLPIGCRRRGRTTRRGTGACDGPRNGSSSG